MNAGFTTPLMESIRHVSTQAENERLSAQLEECWEFARAITETYNPGLSGARSAAANLLQRHGQLKDEHHEP